MSILCRIAATVKQQQRHNIRTQTHQEQIVRHLQTAEESRRELDGDKKPRQYPSTDTMREPLIILVLTEKLASSKSAAFHFDLSGRFNEENLLLPMRHKDIRRRQSALLCSSVHGQDEFLRKL